METGLALVIVTLLLIYMQSRHILRPAATIMITPTGSTGMPTLGAISVAVVGYLAILSVLPDKWALPLTGLIALGALQIDATQMGQYDTINVLFGKTPGIPFLNSAQNGVLNGNLLG